MSEAKKDTGVSPWIWWVVAMWLWPFIGIACHVAAGGK
jgi:hypothetical protein